MSAGDGVGRSVEVVILCARVNGILKKVMQLSGGAFFFCCVSQRMSHRTFTYDVTREEKQAFVERLLRYVHRTARSPMRCMARAIGIALGVGALAAALIYFVTADTLPAVLFGSGIIPMALVYQYYLYANYIKLCAIAFVQQQKDVFPLTHQVEFVDAKAQVAWGDKSFEFLMVPPARIYSARGWTDIVNPLMGSGFGIPHRAFASRHDRIQFVKALTRRITQKPNHEQV